MRIILLGPTAVGKTATSLELAESINAAIISADSRQCYKYMNIGTATPDPNELDRVPHYNISIFPPDQRDTAADFQQRISDWEEEIRRDYDHILYVGGSTLYLQAIMQPFDDVPESNKENIEKLQSRIEQEGIEPLYQKLQEVDPEYAKRMDGMNPQRIVRALDVWQQTGRAFSSYHTNEEVSPSRNTLVFGLHRPRKKLHERIHRRVDLMLQKGLLEEVEELLEMGFNNDVKALKTVGYREPIEYLHNNCDYESMTEQMRIRTRQYAKKQITWFRRWEFIDWLHADKRKPSMLAEQIKEKLAGL